MKMNLKLKIESSNDLQNFQLDLRVGLPPEYHSKFKPLFSLNKNQFFK